MVKKLFICLLLAVCACGTLCAQNMKDVVYLKNGGVIKGTIMEQVPGQSLKIQTSDGSVFVYNMSEVEKIGKEQASTQNTNYNSSHYTTNYKNPTTAWALSFLIPGGGQFYNGQSGKGVAFLGGYVVSFSVFWFVSWPIGLGGMLVTSIWSQIDAPMTANQLNRMNQLSFALSDKVSLGVGPSVINMSDCGMGGGLASGLSLSLTF